MSDELVAQLRAQRPNGEPISVARLMDEAADEIERLTAQLAEARESERAATEREAQAKLDGVRAGLEASAGACEAAVNTIAPGKIMERMACGLCFNNIRALDAKAIAKGEG